MKKAELKANRAAIMADPRVIAFRKKRKEQIWAAKAAVVAVGYDRKNVSVRRGVGYIYITIYGITEPGGLKPGSPERDRLFAEYDRLHEIVRAATGRPAPTGDSRNDTYVGDGISITFQQVR